MQMINFGKILQNLLVVGVQIVASEVSATPEPKPLVKMDPLGPPPQPQARTVKIISDAPLPVGTRLVTDQPSVWEPAPVSIATTPATQKRLKERLAEELYRMQMDLEDGAHIGGLPCDCLDGKHKLGLRATAKELLVMDDTHVPQEVLGWLATHEPELNPTAISKYGPDHYKKLATDMREFRKKLGE
jgi:hypothetical protein